MLQRAIISILISENFYQLATKSMQNRCKIYIIHIYIHAHAHKNMKM